MDALISSLPQNMTDAIHGFYTYNDNELDEGNICTRTQVTTIKEKGWTAYYTDDNGLSWKEYEGSEEPSGINTVHVGDQHHTVIYTLHGMKLNTNNLSDLPKGIYIVNGKKMIVK